VHWRKALLRVKETKRRLAPNMDGNQRFNIRVGAKKYCFQSCRCGEACNGDPCVFLSRCFLLTPHLHILCIIYQGASEWAAYYAPLTSTRYPSFIRSLITLLFVCSTPSRLLPSSHFHHKPLPFPHPSPSQPSLDISASISLASSPFFSIPFFSGKIPLL